MYTVCKGHSYLWAAQSWGVNDDGTIGGAYPRRLTPTEHDQILKDIKVQRTRLYEWMHDLDKAEEIMTTRPQLFSEHMLKKLGWK